MPRQGARNEQPGIGHQAVIVEGDLYPVGVVRGSIYWVLLVSERFSVQKPLSQIQRSTLWLLQGLSQRPSFGGFGVREKERFLEQWRMDATDLRRRMILAPTPREREGWYAILLLAQGLTAAATAEALERDPHTIGRWASAFGEGGPAALIFEQTGGSPPPLTRRSRRS